MALWYDVVPELLGLHELASEGAEEDVVAFCRKELTGYKIPKHVRFIDALPKSTVGKILRRELRDVA